MKGIGRKILGYFFLFVAILLVASGAIGYAVVGSEPNTEVVIKEVQRTIMVDDNSRQERIDNAEYVEDVDFATGAEIAEARKNYQESVQKYGIGSLYIPTGDISVPLLAGTSEWNLFNGVATGRPDQELGKGLFVGLSHNLINKTLIRQIDLVEKGDFVYLTDFRDVFVYQTLAQEVVHESDTTYFREPQSNEVPKILLYRCEGGSGTEWRRVVYGEYVTKVPIQDADETILDGLNIDLDVAEKDSGGEDTDEGDNLVEKEIVDFVEVEQTVESEPKNFFERIVKKGVDFISQYEWLSDYFLTVYELADNHTILFFVVTVLLFGLYGIL